MSKILKGKLMMQYKEPVPNDVGTKDTVHVVDFEVNLDKIKELNDMIKYAIYKLSGIRDLSNVGNIDLTVSDGRVVGLAEHFYNIMTVNIPFMEQFSAMEEDKK